MKICMKKSLVLKRFVFQTALLATTFAAVAPRPAMARGLLEKPIPAPPFTARALNGNEIRSSSYRGKPILLVLWATWCPTCRKAMPAINALSERFKARGLVTLAISDEDTATLNAYAKENRLWIPMASPGPGVEKYQTGSVPSFMLIDTKGQLIYANKGYSTDMPVQLAALIEEQLNPTPKPIGPGATLPVNTAPVAQWTAQQLAAQRAEAEQCARSAAAQRRNKLPKNAKHNGIFVLDDDGVTPVR